MARNGYHGGCLAIAVLGLSIMGAFAEENYASWESLKNPFPSTGGGGIVIDGYRPIIKDGKCLTDFTASEPGGKIYYNTVEFEAVDVQGWGFLCTNGEWRALDGSMSGTTPFRMFIKRHRPPCTITWDRRKAGGVITVGAARRDRAVAVVD